MPNGEFVINQEALDYLSQKNLKPGFSYQDVWAKEHNNAFTVAKMMQLDLLADTKAALEQALADGQTFKQFQESLRPTLIKKGWWGKQTMVDPLSGSEEEVQLGSDARLKTIYDTNMRTARSAGQWERMQRTKKTHPYLLYSLGPSIEHRQEHVQWDGLLLPLDDPFWQTHYPQNGWGCKCRVRQVSQQEYDKLVEQGVSAREPEYDQDGNRTGRWTDKTKPVQTTAPKVETRTYVNKRTGEVTEVPKGIDPGWDYNAGIQDGERLSQYTSKLNAADANAAKSSIAQTMQAKVQTNSTTISTAFEAWYQKPIGDFPIGIISQVDQLKIGATVQAVVLSEATVTKQVREHPEVEADEYSVIQQAMDEGEVIQDSPTTLIYILESQGYVSVVKATKTGQAIFLSSFRRLSNDEAKRDKEIQRLRSKSIE